ncbi:MAG: aspartate 1-decarboxylase [Gammaproteobacteria bacterium]|nr:aspartate 1-decarboxylase [Gammaproteobacteria bacterium]|tara:strand:- start:30001 stop:30378 length:378 start_codon:yes stop_codon:yes gene_type:complete
MIKTFLNSKIHKGSVTDSRIDYEGSCEIDISLLNACGIKPYEKIDIYNISNGERLSTYAIPGKAESGIICVNGAACHKVKIKDKIIICSYIQLNTDEIVNHKPTIIYVDDKNQIIQNKNYINLAK